MKRLLALFTAICLSGIGLSGAHNEEYLYVPDPDPLIQQRLSQWQDLKFGLLMHWGPYSQWGVVESWSICSEDESWCVRDIEDYELYKRRYRALPETFIPHRFDPDRWAEAAANAGMKYVVFTTKHHDGFCMFDSQYTDYKITSPQCPFSKNPRADVTAEIFKAFRSRGFWTGAYFSKPDWNSPYYWWPRFATPDRNVNYSVEKYPERWNSFVQYTHNQVLELVSRYGPLDILWLDGGWVRALTPAEIEAYKTRNPQSHIRYQNQDIDIAGLARKARSVQPRLIIVDRAVPGPCQNYLTPENRVPDDVLPYPWESCIIMGGGWSYNFNPSFKEPRELIHLLADIVCKGGNLLLNIGPGPDGSWYPQAYERLTEMGRWLRVNGEAIYGSRPRHPYKSGNVCLTAGKTGTVYLIYLASEAENTPPAIIAVSGYCPPEHAVLTILGDTTPLKWEKSGDGFRTEIPGALRLYPPCADAWTIKVSAPAR